MVAGMTDQTANWEVDQQLQSPIFGRLPAEIRLNIFTLSLEEYYDRPIRHNFRIRYNHDGGPDDDGILSSSCESASFTDSEAGEDTDEEDNGDHEFDRQETSVGFKSSAPFHSMEFEENESDSSWYPSSERGSDLEDPDPSWRPPAHNHLLTWLRPGSLGIPKISTSLLRTCRRTYLETQDLPASNATIHIWANDAPRDDRSEAYDATGVLYRCLTPRQRNRIITAHLHCSELFKTGPKALWGLCTGPQQLLRRIEHLRLSVLVPRVMFPFFWDPYHPDAAGTMMSENMAATADFGGGGEPPESLDAEWEPPVLWGAVAWAELFRYLPSLQTFTMDFDADAEARHAVGEIAEWAARVWRFPLGPRPDRLTYLAAQGNPVKKMSWRGPPCSLRACAECPGEHVQGLGHDGECPWSARQIVLLEKGVGERMYTWTVRWTARMGKGWVSPVRIGKWPALLAEVRNPSGRTTWGDNDTI